jgi:hypothetical protein
MEKLFLGTTIGLMLSALIQYLNTESVKNVAEKAKAQCERALPRDQHCTIIAVPPSKD